jgi:2-methylcitrate dehydratase PrpD
MSGAVERGTARRTTAATVAARSRGAAASCSEQLGEWASRLSCDAIPARVLAFAKSQLLSQLAAARTTLQHPLGAVIVRAFGSPLQSDAKRSAYVLAVLTMALDYDDTLYAGHVSHSTVNVPLGYARALSLDGRGLLAAIVCANECAARVTAAAALGPFRGQMASHPHLAGAVAARLHAESASRARWTSALGLAYASPPWNLQHAFLASGAKALTAATSVQIGLDACDAAAAGLSGAVDVFEHEDGFLARFADVPMPEAITLGLSDRWHTETLSFKCAPASTGAHSSVDCALALHRRLGGVEPDSITEVVVRANLLTVRSDEAAAGYLAGPDTPLPALQYALAYGVATALLRGALGTADFAEPATRDAARWSLAGKVRVEHDPALTARALAATAPLGEALRQAGERARPWLRAAGGSAVQVEQLSFGAPAATFADADKAIGARVTLRFCDGSERSHECAGATGAAGGETRLAHPRLMRAKFLASGGPASVADTIAEIDVASSAEVGRAIESAFADLTQSG